MKRDTNTISASSKTFNVNENYKIQKENEWWIKQKYKLMKALMRKRRQSEESKLGKQEKPTIVHLKTNKKNQDMIFNISI